MREYLGGICPTRLGMYVWTCLVNENDWARRLDRHLVVLSWPGLISRSSWAQAHGTHSTYIKSVLNHITPRLILILVGRDYKDGKTLSHNIAAFS